MDYSKDVIPIDYLTSMRQVLSFDILTINKLGINICSDR